MQLPGIAIALVLAVIVLPIGAYIIMNIPGSQSTVITTNNYYNVSGQFWNYTLSGTNTTYGVAALGGTSRICYETLASCRTTVNGGVAYPGTTENGTHSYDICLWTNLTQFTTFTDNLTVWNSTRWYDIAYGNISGTNTTAGYLMNGTATFNGTPYNGVLVYRYDRWLDNAAALNVTVWVNLTNTSNTMDAGDLAYFLIGAQDEDNVSNIGCSISFNNTGDYRLNIHSNNFTNAVNYTALGITGNVTSGLLNMLWVPLTNNLSCSFNGSTLSELNPTFENLPASSRTFFGWRTVVTYNGDNDNYVEALITNLTVTTAHVGNDTYHVLLVPFNVTIDTSTCEAKVETATFFDIPNARADFWNASHFVSTGYHLDYTPNASAALTLVSTDNPMFMDYVANVNTSTGQSEASRAAEQGVLGMAEAMPLVALGVMAAVTLAVIVSLVGFKFRKDGF